jgi:hypothetical protein
MRDLIREENSFGANPGTMDLARHLYTRMNCGKVVIVASNPNALLSPLRKQWLKLARKVQKERASTLNATRIYELNEMAKRMHTLQFSTKWPPDGYEQADVYIATIDELMRWAPETNCRTLYVTCELKSEQLHSVTAWMPKNALITSCRLATS